MWMLTRFTWSLLSIGQNISTHSHTSSSTYALGYATAFTGCLKNAGSADQSLVVSVVHALLLPWASIFFRVSA